MRLPIIPAWFPLRALALQGVMALCVLLFCLAPLWYVTWKLEADIKGLETRIQVQETLQPLMEGLRPSRQFPAPCPPAERTAVAFRHGIFERHPFRRASRILAGDLGHVHATGQHAAALMKG